LIVLDSNTEVAIADIEALKGRGPASNEKSVANLRERVALLEDILGIA